MKKILALIGVVSIVLVLTSGKSQRRLFIAGDSTAQNYRTSRTLQRGWGQLVQKYLGDNYTVVNMAKAGRSTKSFIDEGRWQAILDSMSSNDVVIIQFGHNDKSTKPERHTEPEEYKNNLRRMISDVRSKGGKPVLATSIVMRTFKDSVFVDDLLLEYPALTRQVGREQKVPVIDANTMMRDTVLLLGNEKSKELYMWIEAGVDSTYKEGRQDDTHLRESGANAVAKFIGEELLKLNL